MSDLFNVEVEQGLLGAILCNNDALARCGPLEVEHFLDPVHGRIFRLARDRINEGRLASPTTLKFALQDDEGLKQLGGPAYLARMAGSGALSAVAEYAALVRELWARRALLGALRASSERVQAADGGTVEEIAAALEGEVAEIMQAGCARPLSTSYRTGLMRAVQQINRAYMDEAPLGVTSGLKRLDELLGSFAPARSYILAGRPSMGKTAIGWAICNRIAGTGKPVVFASLEMSEEDLIRRAISQSLRSKGQRIPYFALERGKLTEEQMRLVIEEARAQDETPVRLITRDNRELGRLSMAIRATAKAISPVLIVVDYLQLVEVQAARTTFDRVSAVSKALKALAIQTDVPVLALSQLSRAVEERDPPRPQLSDLRASGEIEEDADVVMMAYRPDYYLERSPPGKHESKKIERHAVDMATARDTVEIIVAKQRGGKTGTARLYCDIACNYIGDIEERPAEAAQQQAMDL